MLTEENRNDLVIKNLPFAEKIAYYKSRRVPRSVQFDELKSAAYIGLFDAACKYDGSCPFVCYAFSRINGEIRDYLRSLSLSGRSKFVKFCSLGNINTVC